MQKGLREKTSDKRKGKETFKGLKEWNREKGNKGQVKVVDLKLYFHYFFSGSNTMDCTHPEKDFPVVHAVTVSHAFVSRRATTPSF